MSIVKSFQHKVYKPSVTTVNNRVPDGDFEGDKSTWATLWSGYGSGVAVNRNAPNAYPSSPTGRAIIFNGFSSYFAIPYQGVNGLFTNSAGVIVWMYKSNWQDGLAQAMFSNDYFDGTTACGFGIKANFSAGFISAIAGIGTSTTYKEAKSSLAGLSSGWHQFAMKFDGRFLTLLIDGAQTAQFDIGTTGNVINYGSNNIGPTLVGAQRGIAPSAKVPVVGSPPSYFLGYVDFVATYIAGTNVDPLPNTSVLDNYNNHVLIETNCNYAYTFDLDLGTAAAESIGGNIGILKNVTFATGILETSRSLKITTATGGATTQGVQLTSAGQIVIVGGNIYTATAWVKGTAGAVINLQITPIGGGSVLSKSLTLVGSGWQRISFTYTANAGATKFEIDIFLSSANSSIQTFYVDKVMLEDGSTAHDYFNRYTPNGAGAFYTYDLVNLVHIATLYSYTYLTTWADVTSDFNYNQEINLTGTESTVVLARAGDNFGEGADVSFNNRVIVSVISDNYPNGQTVFTGYISRYTPSFGEDKVEVTLLGYAAEMDNYTISAGESTVIAQEDASAGGRGVGSGLIGISYMGQGFTTTADQTSISSVDIFAASSLVPSGIDPTTPPYVNNCAIKLWEKYTDAQSDTSDIFNHGATKTPLGIARLTIADGTFSWRKFTFYDVNGNPSPVRVSPNSLMYWTVTTDLSTGSGEPAPLQVQSSAINPITPGYMFRAEGPLVEYNGTLGNPNSDLCFHINAGYGLTTVAYNSLDPSTILKRIVDDYNRQGGTISYTSSSIDTTGSTVSYTFNTNSTLEGIKKCLELAPVDWYFYVDQATNILHFHNKSTAQTRTLTFDKDIEHLKFEKTTENMVNQIIFTGGIPTGGTASLFKKYDNKISQGLYGLRQQRYSDNRVTLSATADIIANTILGTRFAPEIRTTVEILNPYNLEIFRPGDLVIFRGFRTSSGSLYDVATYDNDYYDFNISDPQTYVLQVARFQYAPDSIQLTLSSVPPDVNKRIEDIKRQLDAAATVANPVSPS
jgi:hypothetical protein